MSENRTETGWWPRAQWFRREERNKYPRDLPGDRPLNKPRPNDRLNRDYADLRFSLCGGTQTSRGIYRLQLR